MLAAALVLLALGCDGPVVQQCTPGQALACVPDGGGGGAMTCGSDARYGPCEPGPRPDAGPRVVEPVAPALPATECAPGWGASAPGICEPWPAGAPDCAPPMRRAPGEAACARLGPACPAGDLPDVTPPGAIHVVEGAIGGDGSRAAPFGTLAAGLAALGEGGTLILGRGIYREPIVIPTGATVRGACPELTRLETVLPGTTSAAVHVDGTGTRLEGVTIATDRDFAVRVGPGAELAVAGVWIDGADVAFGAFSGGRLEVEDALVTNTAYTAFQLNPLTSLRIRRVTVERTDTEALRVGHQSDAELEDVLIAEMTDPDDANAIFVDYDAVLVARRLVIERSVGHHLTAFGIGASVTIEDSAFRDADGQTEAGMRALGELRLTLRRTSLTGPRQFAIAAGDPGAVVVLEDVTIAGVRPHPSAVTSAGLELSAGARAELRRVLVSDVSGMAILADGATTSAQLEDVTIEDLRGHLGGTFGRALQLQRGATATLARVAIARAREVALAVTSGASARATDLAIRETLERECAVTTCAEAPAGMGIVALGATLTLERFAIERSRLCGVQIADEGAIDARSGYVRANRIGACLQVPGYDPGRLSDGVVYLDNERNIDSTTLPVPDAFAPPISP